MRALFLIIGVAFIVFAIIAWIAQAFSIAYIGLIGFGLVSLLISYLARGATE